MLDGRMRRLIDPPLDRAGRWLAVRGASPDGVTLAGLALALACAVAVALALPAGLALLFLAASRLCDGLDGAVARATRKTDFGGMLDIACDFVFYAALPLAFALRDPGANALAAAFVIASFYVNAATFLGFAILAAKRGMETRAQGEKSLYYAAGLLEGTETIACFALMVLFPGAFVPLAVGFGLLCLVTAAARMVLAARVFRA